jgi:hypothetical protein
MTILYNREAERPEEILPDPEAHIHGTGRREKDFFI